MTHSRITLALAACLSLSLGSALPAQQAAEPAPDATTTPEAAGSFAPVPGDSVSLDDLVWKKRPVVVFADSPNDPAFTEQIRRLSERWPELAARDVIVITDTTPEPPSSVRLKLRPRGFSLVIIAKDGTVNLRKPAPWDAREVIRSIDKMPIRREEVRNGALR